MYRDTCFSLGCCAAICLRVEHYASCFARALGLVHRQVCGMHQLFGLLFSTYSYADARGSVQPELISIGEGDTKLCLEVLCDPNRSAGIGDVLQQDGELIPPRRAPMSASRKHLFKRLATSRSTLSPSWWPKASFMSLREASSSSLIAALTWLALGLGLGLVLALRNGGWFVLLQRVARRRLARAGNLPPHPYDFLEWGIEKQIFRRVGG
jgi:hypothetical protein